ncbi:hypothetical protein P7H59_01290 [Enterococcus viikkiensis]|uniref:Uncharacterized protein n=1 Tax=Enterococcus viikkiensis TaxID=930854 RepID=A0ABU3FM96_9ENTE|nr:hypothetical protein [Enterococcus viikkiensis]MDT2827080.1 hypothetical protein [Enterococcus viikkiensis]
MKKAVWIYSINLNDGGSPFGSFVSLRGLGAKKFRKELISALQPEIALQFISYDSVQHPPVSVDIVIFNELDARYLPEALKKTGLTIPSQDIVLENIDKIKQAILASLK